MREFLDGYLEALAFTDQQADDECAGCELSPELLASAADDCERFQQLASILLERAYAAGYGADQAGRDLWFTRNGHGVGFWDRPQLAGDLADGLCAIVTDHFSGRDIYRGDDSLVYSS